MTYWVPVGVGILVSPAVLGIAVVAVGRRFIRSGTWAAGVAAGMLLLAAGFCSAALIGAAAVRSDTACLDHAPRTIGEGVAYRQSWGLWPPGLRCWYTDVAAERPPDYVGGAGGLVAGGTAALVGGCAIGVLRFERRRSGRT